MVKPKALLKTDFVTVLKNMFQANYSDTQIAKNEAVPVCVCVCVCFVIEFEHAFVRWGTFRRSHSEEF